MTCNNLHSIYLRKYFDVIQFSYMLEAFIQQLAEISFVYRN